jgi:hypothetical protein
VILLIVRGLFAEGVSVMKGDVQLISFVQRLNAWYTHNWRLWLVSCGAGLHCRPHPLELQQRAPVLPSWLCYFLVTSLLQAAKGLTQGARGRAPHT